MLNDSKKFLTATILIVMTGCVSTNKPDTNQETPKGVPVSQSSTPYKYLSWANGLTEECHSIRNRDGAEQAIKCYDILVEKYPNHACGLNNYAWLLATHSESKYRNKELALKYSLRSVENSKNLSESHLASHLDTLAAAYAENGDFENAIKIQQEVIKLRKSSEKSDSWLRLKLYKENQPFHE